MIKKFDYEEPNCPLKGGKAFYYPEKEGPIGQIPVGRVIERADSLFDKNEYTEAGRLLVYWRDEAVALRDKRGELAMESELIGFYRKQGEKEKALISVSRALALAEELGQSALSSGGTIFINCATAYKAFGMAKEAIPLYERALAVYQKTLDKADPRFGGLYNNMALALADEGRFEEAEGCYLSALSVMEKVPQGEAECAITYINLAHMYETVGKKEKINPCMETAYKLLQSKELPRNGYYAFVLEKCAPSFGYFGFTDIYARLKKESEDIYAGN